MNRKIENLKFRGLKKLMSPGGLKLVSQLRPMHGQSTEGKFLVNNYEFGGSFWYEFVMKLS